MRRKIKRQDAPADYSSRIRDLEADIENLADAIASGLLKSSPALAQRLSTAEDELERLQAAQKPALTTKMVPKQHYRALVSQLEASLSLDVERARVTLQDVIGQNVML